MSQNITLILIIITVVTSIYGWNNPGIQTKWMFNPFSVHHGKQYYRLLSSGFVHSNTTHLVFNMIALYFFGGVIERIYGNVFGSLGILFYLITYLAGIIVANLKTLVKHKNSSYYNSLGASGGVASVLFAAILYRPTVGIYLYFLVPIPAFILGAIYLLYSYYSGKKMADNVNHDAHLFGSLFGIVFTVLLRPMVLIEFFKQILEFDITAF
ncbi:MAG: rhomboid family intramembrane serine protease [Cyclobacteriaceae bacterium]|nr:rhomboid family intramembrane serine protease [Cyclobacteriaceae bacterium]MCK5702127.1 rhomboid family intramembrane serine protease [Cyclobacteriaceae bacterium]